MDWRARGSWTAAAAAVGVTLAVGSSAVPASAQAWTETRHYTYEQPWVWSGYMPECGGLPGEIVHFTGTFTAVTHDVGDASGGSHSFERSFLRGQGIGEDSGAKYLTSDAGPEWIWGNDNSGPATTDSVLARTLIVRTGAPGVWIDFSRFHHETTNANGETTADVDGFEPRCVAG